MTYSLYQSASYVPTSIFSPPVLMHSGLICIAIRLSLTGPKFTGGKNPLDDNSELFNCNSVEK